VAGNPAIALVVAGSGATTEQEVFDLLDDAYPEDAYADIGLIFPVDKDLFTDTVENVLAWLDDPKAYYPVRSKGANLTRKTSKFDGVEEIEEFTDALQPDLYLKEGWDEVQFLLAVPDDEEDPDYELCAELAEVAIGNGMVVKNLSRGLDDVTLAEPEDEAPPVVPEPEEEYAGRAPSEAPKRARRSRKAQEPVEEPETAPEPAQDGLQEDLAKAAHDAKQDPAEGVDDEALRLITEAIGQASRALALIQESMEIILDIQKRKQTPLEGAKFHEAADVGPSINDETPKRRGRPRTNFEVKQIWDEDEDEWVPRPKGRMRKGTKWRTIHAETDEVLEEGTA
jgi:hypothetical protein